MTRKIVTESTAAPEAQAVEESPPHPSLVVRLMKRLAALDGSEYGKAEIEAAIARAEDQWAALKKIADFSVATDEQPGSVFHSALNECKVIAKASQGE